MKIGDGIFLGAIIIGLVLLIIFKPEVIALLLFVLVCIALAND